MPMSRVFRKTITGISIVTLLLLLVACQTTQGWRSSPGAPSGDRMKDLEKQVEVLTARLSKMEYELRFNVASNQASLGKYEQAIKVFQELIKSNPESPFAADSLYEIAKIYKYNLKNIEKAVSTYKDLLGRYPKSEFRRTAMFEVAECYMELGRKSEALSQYKDIITRYGKDPVAEKAYFEIGDMMQQAGNFPEARDAYAKLLGTFPKGELEPAARYRLAVCVMRLSDTESAIREFSRVFTEFASSDVAELSYMSAVSALGDEKRDSEARARIGEYLIRYPNGRYRTEFERFLEKLNLKKTSSP